MTEICKLLVASTAHVTAEEAKALTDMDYRRGDYGWFFYVGERGDHALSEFSSFSDGLAKVIRLARSRGCQYLLLDRDVAPLSDVPTYEW